MGAAMPEFTSYATGTPCWVDVTSPELDRSVSFYSDHFGWEAEQDPRPEAGGYTMFKKNGKYVAAGSPPFPGSQPPSSAPAPAHWTTYIASDDVDGSVARIGEAGGSVLVEPFDVFDAGRMAVVQDPAGATFGIWQAGAHHGAELANEPGSLTWNECQTTDAERAEKFYRAVFAYDVEAVQMDAGPLYRVLKIDGKSVGGLMPIRPEMGEVPPNWATCFAVEDADAACARTDDLGGRVLASPLDLPRIGRFAVLQDPVGAVFQVLSDPAAE